MMKAEPAEVASGPRGRAATVLHVTLKARGQQRFIALTRRSDWDE
jgi:hypothetical protein